MCISISCSVADLRLKLAGVLPHEHASTSGHRLSEYCWIHLPPDQGTTPTGDRHRCRPACLGLEPKWLRTWRIMMRPRAARAAPRIHRPYTMPVPPAISMTVLPGSSSNIEILLPLHTPSRMQQPDAYDELLLSLLPRRFQAEPCYLACFVQH